MQTVFARGDMVPAPRRLRLARNLLLMAGAVTLLIYPWVFSLPFPRHLMIMVFLYATLAQAWNILGGYAGQMSLAQHVFFGAGAYTSTLLLVKLGLSPWLGAFASVVVASCLAIIIGYPCFKLKGHYFSIATLIIGEISLTAMINWKWAGGAAGLSIRYLERSSLVLFQFSDKLPYYYIALGMVALIFITVHRIERSKPGYYFRAIKDDPDATQMLGIDIARYRLLAFAIHAAFTAVTGVFYAQYVLFIDPDSVFLYMTSVLAILSAILGGLGTLWGPLLGTLVLVPLSELTRVHWGGGGRAVHLVVYGVLIIVLAVYRPTGLMGLIGQFKRRRLGRWLS